MAGMEARPQHRSVDFGQLLLMFTGPSHRVVRLGRTPVCTAGAHRARTAIRVKP